MSTVEILAKTPIFEGIDISALAKIADNSELISVESDSLIFTKGDKATHLYLVISGSLCLLIPIMILKGEKEIVLDTKHQGALIGWSALVPPHELTMSARVVEAGELLRIAANEIQSLCEQDTQIGYAIMSRIGALIGSRLNQIEHMFAKELQFNGSTL